jgi:hypothetical protein
MRGLWIVAVALLVVWGVLVFVVQPATGWVHLPLAAGVVLVARAIIGGDRGTPRPSAGPPVRRSDA